MAPPPIVNANSAASTVEPRDFNFDKSMRTILFVIVLAAVRTTATATGCR